MFYKNMEIFSLKRERESKWWNYKNGLYIGEREA